MKRLTYNIGTIGPQVEYRIETIDGKPFLVAPVTMMVEGVHPGSGGPLYYGPRVLSQHPESWDGFPVTAGHPRDAAGQPISAAAPGVLEQIGVGYLRGSRFDPDGNRLRSEICIDVERANRLSPASVTTILAGGHLEVSTGVFTNEDDVPGTWNGESFSAEVTATRPDHLALLPGGTGACSWSDGCGVRANARQAEGTKEDLMKGSHGTGKLRALMLSFADALGIRVQEMSHDDLRSALCRAVYALDNAAWDHYVVDVYDGWLVYKANARISNDPSVAVVSPATKLYKRTYSIDAQTGAATLADDAQEVREETNYVPVTANQSGEIGSPEASTAAGNVAQAKKEAETMKKNELIDKLIGCPCTRFAANDRAFLETLNEEQLEKLQPVEGARPPETDEEKAAREAAASQPPAGSTGTQPPPATTAGSEPAPAANEAASTKPQTVEQFIANAPAEIQGTLRRAVEADKARKDALVSGLLANSRNTFTEVQLRAKDIDELTALSSLAAVTIDYAPQGGPAPQANESANQAPPMPQAFPYPEHMRK